MGEDDTSLESLPRMQFHVLEPLRVDDQVCGRCGGPPQAHPTPEALAEWMLLRRSSMPNDQQQQQRDEEGAG